MANSKLQTKDVTKAKEENVISQSELDTLKAQAKVSADLEKQLADLVKEKEATATQLADLEKGKADAEAKLADIEKAKEEAKFAETVDVVKGFNLFEDENVEDVSKFLVKNEANPATALILTTLEKARSAIQAFGEQEHGSDLEGIELDSDQQLSSAVSDIIKARKAQAAK